MRSPEKKFTKIYDQHSDEIFRYFYFRLQNRERALDLTQDVFSRFWIYISSGKKVDQPRAFLYRSAHNSFVNSIRDNKHDISLDMLNEKGLEFAYEEEDREELEKQKEIVDQLKNVDETYREVLTLRYVNGLKVKEIANILNESENTISVRIHRGLEKIKKIYEKN